MCTEAIHYMVYVIKREHMCIYELCMQCATYNRVSWEDAHVDTDWLHISQISLSGNVIDTQCTLDNHVQCGRCLVKVLYSILQLPNNVLSLHTAQQHCHCHTTASTTSSPTATNHHLQHYHFSPYVTATKSILPRGYTVTINTYPSIPKVFS